MTKFNKYNARKTHLNGHTFDSQREARRYQDLLLLERAGRIHSLRLQVPFSLEVAGAQIGKYVADFVYIENDEEVIEDSKGYRTPLYRWKKKHVEAQFNVKIKET